VARKNTIQRLALNGLASGVLLGLWVGTAACQRPESVRLRSRPSSPVEKATSGLSRLAIAGGRETLLYVPSSYRPDHPAPLLVLLHGATQNAELWTRSDDFFRLADELGLVLLMPNSVSTSWDLMRGGYGPDVVRLDSSLAQVFRRCTIDRARIALGGFSDGASYALSLGAGNGDLFSALIAFSPGYFLPGGIQGKPRIYIAHGTRDRILPIDQTSRQLRPQLEAAGYQLSYHEFEGGHTVRPDDAHGALAWFVNQ
jgi:phospholipase/carboxylesterase